VRATWGVSIRRACRVFPVDTSTCHYRSRRPGQAGLEKRIEEICETRVRYGYRRVHVLLRREGWVLNLKKTRRIYNELDVWFRDLMVHPSHGNGGKHYGASSPWGRHDDSGNPSSDTA